ncbi:helix-turn-helix domain-containing protein [Paenibacillus gansuensis]|uniref:Helix-turn-helix domain-containing protein n=1 Tax=Paenibacillus gansuensis TaxID=306542 RepID=A0ABW5P9U3_9BACL
MQEIIPLPKPSYGRYVCYPEYIGKVMDDEGHAVYRSGASSDPFHYTYNLHLVFKGEGTLTSMGRIYELSGGTGFLYGPGLTQEYKANPDCPWEACWVHFSGAYAAELLQDKGTADAWLFSFSDTETVHRLFHSLLESARTFRIEEEASISSRLYELLVRIQYHATQLNEPKDPQWESIRSAADYIRNHCHEDLRLEDMANKAGYSPSYFSRRFHEIIGRPPISFMTESRIVRAKQLLTNTEMTVKQIGEASGFAESSYFIQIFRRHEQMTPAQFRSMFRSG